MKKKRMVAKAPPILASAGAALKLDLACGQSPREGFEGVDIWAGAKHQVNLQQFPWPFDDNSAAELHCSHYIEHIPAEMIQTGGGLKDALFAFFDEAWRILEPGGMMTVICPSARSNRAFQDPTHRRFIVAETFQYLVAEWRRANRLDHYNVACDFEVTLNWTTSSELSVRAPEVQQMQFHHYWNTIHDWHVTLRAVKPSR